jgi:ATP-binding cassette subfamily C (CFTR/MRP) protein 1
MTRFVADPTIPSERGYALVGGFAIIYTLIALSTYLYWEKVFNMTVAYRSALVGTIYMKTLRLSSVAAREVGQVSRALRPIFLCLTD